MKSPKGRGSVQSQGHAIKTQNQKSRSAANPALPGLVGAGTQATARLVHSNQPWDGERRTARSQAQSFKGCPERS